MNIQNMPLNTPICPLGQFVEENYLFVKRDDMIPVSFGGNKARKAILFFEEIDKQACDCVVTYGSASSNHCRIVANMASARTMPCYIISPNEVDKETYNKKMMRILGAHIVHCDVENVKATINEVMDDLKNEGFHPYFIMGGGHGNIGTQAYVECYHEILEYEKVQKMKFDYVFFASGTGTTQAGLICGKLMNKDKKEIIGISIARNKEYGSSVIYNSVVDYLTAKEMAYTETEIKKSLCFVDEYTQGYGKSNLDIYMNIKEVLVKYGIPLDATYTAKAFRGMMDYIKQNTIKNKNILFIHTGGTPLFFNDLNYLDECLRKEKIL